MRKKIFQKAENAKQAERKANAIQKEIDKLVGGLNEHDKAQLMLAVQHARVANRVDEQSVLAGLETAYILLYETYLQPIVEDKLSEEETKENINKLIAHINKEYLKAKLKREKNKEMRKENE